MGGVEEAGCSGCQHGTAGRDERAAIDDGCHLGAFWGWCVSQSHRPLSGLLPDLATCRANRVLVCGVARRKAVQCQSALHPTLAALAAGRISRSGEAREHHQGAIDREQGGIVEMVDHRPDCAAWDVALSICTSDCLISAFWPRDASMRSRGASG